MNTIVSILLGIGVAILYQSAKGWNAKRRARMPKTLDRLERGLGIVTENGEDPELQAFRVKRVQKRQSEQLKQNG